MAKQFKKTASKVQKVIKKAPIVSSKRPGMVARGNVSLPTGDYIATVGRRKSGAARVRLFMKSGDYVVNGKAMADYFSSTLHPEERFMAPFRITGTMGKYAISAKVDGAGVSSQLDAVVLGIARALVKVDEGYKKMLRDAGLLTRDARMKETRKPNMGGKARRRRQSPKR